MRTRVAPSSTAGTKSPVMPMDRWVKFVPKRSSSPVFNSRNPANMGRARSGSSKNGGIVINPTSRTPSIPMTASANSDRFSTAIPDFCASPAMFTWMRTS